MARVTLPFVFISFFFCFSICFNYVQGEGDRWCVAQMHVPENVLTAFIADKCQYLYCKPIMPGGSCFQPDTVQNHASYVIDVNYKATGECDPSIAMHAVTDPSFGRCRYP